MRGKGASGWQVVGWGRKLAAEFQQGKRALESSHASDDLEDY